MVKKPQKPEKKSNAETEPSSWDRFEDAIHKIAPPKKVAKKAGASSKNNENG